MTRRQILIGLLIVAVLATSAWCNRQPDQNALRATSDAAYRNAVTVTDDLIQHFRDTFPDIPIEVYRSYYEGEYWFDCTWTPRDQGEPPASIRWSTGPRLAIDTDRPGLDLIDDFIADYLNDGAVIVRDDRDHGNPPSVTLDYHDAGIVISGVTRAGLDEGWANYIDLDVSTPCFTPPDDILTYDREHPERYFTPAPIPTS
ncbi:hypothetical protein [Cellulomonas taurus]|uniref:hypothetical protein n=1 Tax=Cellulomonas taurus TaxID=2729175 RepID=UPI00145EAA38|nr:hypothetical protein [Cellulomonas taurus]